VTISIPELARPSFERLGFRPDLEGMRGVAMLLVLGAHMRTLLPDVGRVRLYSGFFGVDVFFVLSGFLITTLLLEELRGSRAVALGRFFGRRALRLFPALVFGIGVAAVCAALLARYGHGYAIARPALWALLCVANWSDGSLGILAHTWSLGVEQQYYLVWPFALLACLVWSVRLRSIAVVLLCGSVLVAIARIAVLYGDGPKDLVWGALRTDSIMIGTAFALLFATDGRLREILSGRRVIGVSVLLIAGYMAYAEIGGRTGRASLTKDLITVGCVGVALLIGALRTHVPNTFLAHRRLVYLGRISYPLYLVHYPVFATFARIGPRDAGIRLVLALGVAVALAAAAHHFVEQPALRLKDRLLDRERVGRRSDARQQVQRG
jgi:peptidoglycan/LPS O-acetylase OafA/YrhL